jgi:hypothetical protein
LVLANLLEYTSYVSALLERLTIPGVAVIEGAQVTLNDLQLVNATVAALNVRLNITETAASNAATKTALEMVNTTLQVVNSSCVKSLYLTSTALLSISSRL